MVTNWMWDREIQESGIRREEIFITTKVWKSYQGYDSTLQACEKVAPEGGSLIDVAEHLGSWIDPKPREDQQELEDLLDLMQPGWRQVIIKKRPLPNMLVSNAVVTAAAGGLAGRPDEKIGDNLYVVGDCVGKEGLLSNASFASAKRAADLILDA